MSTWIATLEPGDDSTVWIRDVDGPRATQSLPYEGDEDDALMALHDADWLTVGSTWGQDERTGTRWIELEQWVEDEHDGSGPGPEGD